MLLLHLLAACATQQPLHYIIVEGHQPATYSNMHDTARQLLANGLWSDEVQHAVPFCFSRCQQLLLPCCFHTKHNVDTKQIHTLHSMPYLTGTLHSPGIPWHAGSAAALFAAAGLPTASNCRAALLCKPSSAVERAEATGTPTATAMTAASIREVAAKQHILCLGLLGIGQLLRCCCESKTSFDGG